MSQPVPLRVGQRWKHKSGKLTVTLLKLRDDGAWVVRGGYGKLGKMQPRTIISGYTFHDQRDPP